MAAEAASYQKGVENPGPEQDGDDGSGRSLFTGITVVLFNYAVHEIRDLCWDGIPNQGASWLREEPLEAKWARVIFIPTFGGLVVSVLKIIQAAIDNSTRGSSVSNFRSTLKSILNIVAACVTLGTGNSLGPEGPSVEICVSVAKGVGTLIGNGGQRKLSLRAAGSAAGLSSGFNAAVAGCFFAVESVLWPSPTESSLSLTNTTSMVILSAVIASVISEVGLGSEPAFAVPVYDFGSPSGMAYGKVVGYLFSVSNPIFHLSILEVASPQAYGLVGMAATLAGVCEVPLTAVLLLFELAQDYRIVLPLLGAVGLSSWVKSLPTRKSTTDNTGESKDTKVGTAAPEEYFDSTSVQNSIFSSYLDKSNGSSICEVESSLCLDYDDDLANEILV